MSSSSTSLEARMGVFVPRRRDNIPDVLFTRSLGQGHRTSAGGISRCSQPARMASTLSSAVAWNPGRLQNMILAVGPGTPASALLDADPIGIPSTSSEENDDESDESDQEENRHIQEGQACHDVEESNDEEDEDSNDAALGLGRAMWLLSRQLQEVESDESSYEYLEEDPDISPPIPTGKLVSSMRHGGCINTASWLTSPWRLSLAGHEDGETSAHVVDCQEHPTQLLTSGDDMVVKVWDLRFAMGSSNPLPGGRYVQPPFADLSQTEPCDWKKHFANHKAPVAGSVILLATLQTGHLNNVFHVAPLDHHPGKVSTCGADGYLRISDMNSSSGASTVVVSPENDQDYTTGLLPASLLRHRTRMCFSHHFLDANCGLLCGERGLKHFDIRMSPRGQRSRSILGNNDEICKSCAIWSGAAATSDGVDSAYVFAGGSSGDVTLFDLRMTDPDANKVVQKYCPSRIQSKAVSVSGLDITKDKRELLVSYENDQIYTFPIFPDVRSAAGPTLDEISGYCRSADTRPDRRLNELAVIGGHLNRFTFLKSAKYAGPNDEYIVTGSDSGNAWIYEKASGVVSSLMFADRSTCNGVIPHPTLPIFATYGIDSTAKLWRATNPVDGDDSPLGRARRFHQQRYKKSPIVQNYNFVEMAMALDCDMEGESGSDVVGLLPDQLPASNITHHSSINMGGIVFEQRRRCSRDGEAGYTIGNDLRHLDAVVQTNFYDCAIASTSGAQKPVQSGLRELQGRISNIRLRHQADQRGLLWNSSIPWILRSRERYLGAFLGDVGAACSVQVAGENAYGNLADLVPESPSDWIPFDQNMVRQPLPCGTHVNLDRYSEFYAEHYKIGLSSSNEFLSDKGIPWVSRVKSSGAITKDSASEGCLIREATTEETAELPIPPPGYSFDIDHALSLLYETALLLKAGGNAALAAGSTMEAARRYDRAIRYCSLAHMDCGKKNEDLHAKTHLRWTVLRKLLVMTRLNLCMVLTKIDTKAAMDQGTLAHQELSAFCRRKGKILCGTKLDAVYKHDEPEKTYMEAKELEAKTFFRLGCVQMMRFDYEEAVESFEESVKCMKELSKDPEVPLLRRLVEAKRERSRKTKRQRKKFKGMFES